MDFFNTLEFISSQLCLQMLCICYESWSVLFLSCSLLFFFFFPFLEMWFPSDPSSWWTCWAAGSVEVLALQFCPPQRCSASEMAAGTKLPMIPWEGEPGPSHPQDCWLHRGKWLLSLSQCNGASKIYTGFHPFFWKGEKMKAFSNTLDVYGHCGSPCSSRWWHQPIVGSVLWCYASCCSCSTPEFPPLPQGGTSGLSCKCLRDLFS